MVDFWAAMGYTSSNSAMSAVCFKKHGHNRIFLGQLALTTLQQSALLAEARKCIVVRAIRFKEFAMWNESGSSDPTRRQKYLDYLKSDRWAFMRAVCMEYYRHSCAICNSTKSLDVHHRTYERLFFELPSDLICLCHKCHELYHGKMDTIDSDYWTPPF